MIEPRDPEPPVPEMPVGLDADVPHTADIVALEPRRTTPARRAVLDARVPPHNLEAEETVLGALLLSRAARAEVLPLLAADDFYRPAHEAIYGAIVDLHDRGEPADAVTVGEELRRRGRLEHVGGLPYLHTLLSSVPTAASGAYYAKIVAELSSLRHLIDAATEIAAEAYEVPEDITGLLARARERLSLVPQHDGSATPLEAATMRELCAIELPPDEDLLGPLLVRGTRVALGGHTGEGKSSFTLQMLKAFVRGDEFLGYRGRGGRALVIDAEQGLRTLQRRAGEMGLETEDRIDVLRVPDGLALTSNAAQRAQLEGLLERGRYDVVTADPLYKLHDGESKEERHAVALMSIFDRWRERYGFALVIPVHLRKPPPQGGTKFTLHEFFGSGAFTWGAEVILGIQRVRPGYSKLHIFKDRDGPLPVGESWGLYFNRERGYWRDMENAGAKQTTVDLVREVLEQTPGMTISQIEEAVKKTSKPVRDALRALKAVETVGLRNAKTWSLPSGAPPAMWAPGSDEEEGEG